MEYTHCKNLKELKEEKKFLENKLNVKIQIKGKTILVDGPPLDEYEALTIINAIDLGFPAKTASLLTDEDYIFEKIKIRDFTRRKNLSEVKARLIGTKGKTKKTIENISGSTIKIKDGLVGIIGPADSIQYALTALINIIKGTKQANAYKYLERIKTEKKKRGD